MTDDSRLGSRAPIIEQRPMIARAYIESALLRSKPAASCTPQSFAADTSTCSSSRVTNGFGARFSIAISSRQEVGGGFGGVLPPLPAAAQSSMVAPVITDT